MSAAALHPLSTAAARARKDSPSAGPSLVEMSAAGLRAFFNIARDWGLATDAQIVLLGSPGRSTFFKW